MRYTTLILIGCVLAGCGSPSVNVAFDSSVPAAQQATMSGDFQRISSLSLTQQQPSDAQILGTSDLSASTLVTWLNAHLNLIVGPNYDWNSQSTVSGGSGSSYAVPTSSTSDSSAAQTLMLNLGALIYLQETPQNEIFTLETSRGNIADTTPMIGVVQADALNDPDNLIQGSEVNSLANQFLRIPVYYHEATHDLGHNSANAQNAGLPHALCLTGTYANNYACDSNYNGPYGVQLMLQRNLYAICVTCTSNEQYALALIVADYQSRILPGAQFVDKTPVSVP